MRFVKAILLISIGAVVIVFALSNREAVQVYFFINDAIIEMPLFIFFFISLFMGMLLCAIITIPRKLKAIRELRESRNRMKALENELSGYKTEDKITDSLPVQE